MTGSQQTSRRRFLAAAAASAGAAVLSRASFAQLARVDPTSRATFDAIDASLNGGKGFAGRNNESGQLAWGGSYTSQAYLLMYLAHRDTAYLDKLVTHFDATLAQRDSVRGVTDYRGLSLPAWRAMSDYTCGSVVLNDAQGRPNLEIRSAVRPASDVAVSIGAGSRPGTLKLVGTKNPDVKDESPIVDVYDDLSVNAAQAARQINENFARINATSRGARTMITAVPLSAEGAGGGPVHAGPIPLSAEPYVFAVHTGQITYAAAGFARLVHETPALHAKYRAKAEEYRVAIERALAVSDHEWREDATSGEGWYVWAKGSPAAFDGAELPHNQYLAVARTMIHLAATPSRAGEAYKSRATAMARTFKNDLTRTANDGYTWPYFWSKGWGYRGWTEADRVSEYQPTLVHPKIGGHKNIEDTSHAHLDVDFARLAFENDLGAFDESDMKRFANTFIRNVLTTNKAGRPTTFANVNGTGAKGSADTIAAGWIPLAKWDERIFTSVRDIYENRDMPKATNAVSLLMGLAYLNWYAQQK